MNEPADPLEEFMMHHRGVCPCIEDDYAKCVCGLTAAREQARRMREALNEIAHSPGYDGSLCEDPSDCPNCVASAALTPKEPQ